MMNGMEKSDSAIVAVKSANKGASAPAEPMEPRAEPKGNQARSRNTRLAAIRSFFRHVALHEPQHAALAQRVLAMPSKRHLRSPVAWLDRDEVEALLRAPDPQTRFGRRDRTLLTVAVQTGLRASELIGLRCGDVQLGAGAHVRCRGKGRKERHTPLRREPAQRIADRIDELMKC